MYMQRYIRLIEKIRECAYQVRLDFVPGYLESVYQNALMVLLEEAGISAEKEKAIPLNYHGTTIGDFRADILVEQSIIVELKAVTTLLPIHELQLVNYLKTTGLDVGLLINYGSDQYRITPKFRTQELLNQYKKLLFSC